MSQTKTSANISGRRKVAVFFGGRSPEHDVSVVSGLQALNAVDSSRFDAFPVYISPEGTWYIGDALRERKNYMLSDDTIRNLQPVTFDVNAAQGGVLLPKKVGFFGSGKPVSFDVALPVFHGLFGEDGNIQGLFEISKTPYTGMRTKASAILMDKVATKYYLQSQGIPVLPFAVLRRPKSGFMIPEKELEALIAPIGFPCIIKPAHLGSSIGVAKVNSVAEARACLPKVFEFDTVAIVEPFVSNLVEYNVAVSAAFGEVKTSAIERPKTSDELLDFKQKYLAGGGGKKGGGGVKSPQSSEGMLSLTREINPVLPAGMDDKIRNWAVKMFEGIDGTGAPRIDFIGDSKTGDIWMNEVNPCPGSYGYFLWEAAKDSVLFTDMISALIDEALTEHIKQALPRDPVPSDARLLRRSS